MQIIFINFKFRFTCTYNVYLLYQFFQPIFCTTVHCVFNVLNYIHINNLSPNFWCLCNFCDLIAGNVMVQARKNIKFSFRLRFACMFNTHNMLSVIAQNEIRHETRTAERAHLMRAWLRPLIK